MSLFILTSWLTVTAPAPDAAPTEAPAKPTQASAEAGADAPPVADPATAADAPADVASEGEARDPAAASIEQPEIVELPNEPPPPRETITYQIVQPQDGDPPYYSDEDMAKLRKRHGLDPEFAEPERRARWRCLIADQTCGMTFEIQATSAFARRFVQGDVTVTDQIATWNSGRAQYDAQFNLPVSTETVGKFKYTRLTLGPKGGVIASDTRDVWGDVGMAGRYFFNRKTWSPTLEFSAALTFKLLGERQCAAGEGSVPCTRPERSPVGIHADVGFGLGGFGSIVVGGQYDSPLAREDLPEQFRVASSGMFYVGFRGNILWGGPLAGAVATHAITQRRVTNPNG